MKAGMPFDEPSNAAFKGYLDMWTQQLVPTQNASRVGPASSIHGEVVQNLRHAVGEENFRISMDKTTDSC